MQLFDDEGDDGRAIWIDLNRESVRGAPGNAATKTVPYTVSFPVRTLCEPSGLSSHGQKRYSITQVYSLRLDRLNNSLTFGFMSNSLSLYLFGGCRGIAVLPTITIAS